MDYNAVDGPGEFESHLSYMSKIGVHVTHCCLMHGCKYGDVDCPVVIKTHRQRYSCEICENQEITLGKHTADDSVNQSNSRGHAEVKNPRESRLRKPPYRRDNFTSRQEWEYNNSGKNKS